MKNAKNSRVQIFLSQEILDDFFSDLKRKGRSKNTLENYRRTLDFLYQRLPEDKAIDREVLQRWVDDLIEKKYSIRSVNAKIGAVNSFFNYLDRRDLQIRPLVSEPDTIQPELTRHEYLRLLQTAKSHDKEQLYFIMKLICCTGLFIQDLSTLTVEMIRSGRIIPARNQEIRIPNSLQRELLDYAKRKSINTGLIFVTRSGLPVNRSNIYKSMQQLCQDARVSEQKATPLCLRSLYQSTYSGIKSNMELLAERAYDRLLEQEEKISGWNI